MKSAIALFICLLLAIPAVQADRTHIEIDRDFDVDSRDCRFHNHRVDLDKRQITIYAEEHDDFEIEINREHELYVDGEKISLDADQQKLVTLYYTQFMELTDEAKDIGWEGARIGLQGAGIGLKAVAGVVKMIFTSYDEDELERDMEREAEKIEARAEELEHRAESIEDMAYELEDTFDGMVDGIPELKELDW